MIRRISLLLIALVALASPLLAAGSRDIVLSNDGTLYTVESGTPEAFGITDLSTDVLRLTVGSGDEQQTIMVPGSLGGGSHGDPALAWDENSKTLFVFWRRMPNRLRSELLFASYREGSWSRAKIIDDKVYFSQWNLAIGLTTRATEKTEDGEQLNSALALHAIWWEESDEHGEVARYAQISIRDGNVEGITTRSLIRFLDSSVPNEVVKTPEGFDRELLRHPAIFESPSHDAIEVLFADWNSNRLHRVEIKPVIENGVLTEPIGVHVGQVPAPGQRFQVTGAVTTLRATSGSSFAMYFHDRVTSKLNYFLLQDGEWSTLKQLSINEQLSLDTASSVLRRLVEVQ